MPRHSYSKTNVFCNILSFLETMNFCCQKVILKANLRWDNYISDTEELSTKQYSGFLHALHWKLGIHRYGTMTWMSQTWIRLLFGRMTSFILLSASEKCQQLKLNLNYSLCYKVCLEEEVYLYDTCVSKNPLEFV